ncbi:interleukin-20 receptor subunit alpha [Cololabis saira]|uniref:interleukin-20 receptor subunit alpha n=1 Tax=Cololabis saira TaxID=129043 RepID=UPI002AD42D81|nr:interleukin-20 receptor subunit alpha [Cololabis saira]
MWTKVVFIFLLGLRFSVSHSLPSPTDVSFSSVNLRNVLHWFPGNGAADDTHFTVEYAIYGDSVPGSRGKRVHWRAVRKCTDIMRTWCDLSAETWDEEQGYHARVRAMVKRSSSKWAMTQRRFDPKSDTTFGPPVVSVELEDNSAIISMKGPMRYPPNNLTPISMKAIYPHMTYNLSIHSTHRNQTHHFPVINSSYKYRLLEYNTEYCFSARSRFLSMPVTCQSSEWQCLTTPQDPVIEQLQMAVVGIVVPALFICIFVVAGYLLRVYLAGKGQKSPYMLNQHSFHRSPLAFPPHHANLIISSVIKGDPPLSDPPHPELLLRILDPPPSYSPQGPEAPLGPVEPSEVSIDYGGVCIAAKVNAGGEGIARERGHDEGDAGNNLKAVQDAHSAGNYLSQKCRPSHMQSTLVQALPWKDGTMALSQSAQGSVTGEMEDRECSAIFISRCSQTDLFNIPSNRQERAPVGATLDEEEGRKCENVPLLSSYIFQNVQNMPTPHPNHSDCLASDYGLMMPTAMQKTEEDEFHEMEEGVICIDWDPQTRTLVLPDVEFTKEEELGGLMPLNREEELRMLRNDEELYMTRGHLKLESVFVRQTSEENAEAQKQLQRAETRLEAYDVLTKWDLVISMDQ